MMAFEVSLIGQVLVYSILAVMVLVTIWFSNFITGIIQSKLGDSPRGNDLAKAISMVVAVIVIIPMYMILFNLPLLSELLGMNAFLIIPSTWFADLISWIVISLNGIGLTGSQIIGFSTVLQFDMLMTSALSIGFSISTIVLALLLADRVFTIEAGARTERITTVGRENIILRCIRRISSGSFGALIVTNSKDFLRKAQNLSKIGYGIVLAVILPLLLTSIGEDFGSISEMGFFMVIMMSVIGSMPFAGTGFLESKDQLWIIQSTPKGVSRFVKSRLVSSFLIVLPLTVIPATAVTLSVQGTFFDFLMVLGLGYLAIIGGVLVSTGITARNPNYEDTKSPEHQANMMMSVMIPQFTMMSGLFLDIIMSIVFDIDMFGIIQVIFPGVPFMLIIALQGITIVLFIGSLLTISGIRSLSKPEI
jgi:hypothetical protein